MQKIKQLLKNNTWIVILILSLPAIWALLTPGFYGASDDMHIAWLYEMDRSLMSGKFPVRFVPDLSYGFGYPLFNFVFPLPFYIGEIFHLSGLTLVESIKLVFLLSIPLSALFMYKLLKEFTQDYLAFAGSILYIYTPYRATDIYIRGAIGEIVSFVFLPLIILSVARIIKKDKKWVGIGALSVAALIMSHNITSYMFLPFILVLTVFLLNIKEINISPIVNIVKMFILGLFASMFFWLPAISESRIMKYETVFGYYDHFPTIKQLLLPYFGYGASVPGPGDGMSFDIGTIGLVIIIFGSIYAIIKWKKLGKIIKIFYLWSICMLFFSLLMMNYRSNVIWENVPLIKYFQFPWRFLTLTTLVSPIILIVFNEFKYRKGLAFLVIALSLIVNFSKFKPQDFLGRTDGYYLNRYIPVPEASEEYKKTSEEYLRLPLDAKERPNKNYPLAELLNSTGEIKINSINYLDADIKIIASENTKLNYYKYNYPGWTALLDGRKVGISSGKPFGNITVDIPKGNHNLTIKFQETRLRFALDIFSVASIVYILFFIFKKYRTRN